MAGVIEHRAEDQAADLTAALRLLAGAPTSGPDPAARAERFLEYWADAAPQVPTRSTGAQDRRLGLALGAFLELAVPSVGPDGAIALPPEARAGLHALLDAAPTTALAEAVRDRRDGPLVADVLAALYPAAETAPAETAPAETALAERSDFIRRALPIAAHTQGAPERFADLVAALEPYAYLLPRMPDTVGPSLRPPKFTDVLEGLAQANISAPGADERAVAAEAIALLSGPTPDHFAADLARLDEVLTGEEDAVTTRRIYALLAHPELQSDADLFFRAAQAIAPVVPVDHLADVVERVHALGDLNHDEAVVARAASAVAWHHARVRPDLAFAHLASLSADERAALPRHIVAPIAQFGADILTDELRARGPGPRDPEGRFLRTERADPSALAAIAPEHWTAWRDTVRGAFLEQLRPARGQRTARVQRESEGGPHYRYRATNATPLERFADALTVYDAWARGNPLSVQAARNDALLGALQATKHYGISIETYDLLMDQMARRGNIEIARVLGLGDLPLMKPDLLRFLGAGKTHGMVHHAARKLVQAPVWPALSDRERSQLFSRLHHEVAASEIPGLRAAAPPFLSGVASVPWITRTNLSTAVTSEDFRNATAETQQAWPKESILPEAYTPTRFVDEVLVPWLAADPEAPPPSDPYWTKLARAFTDPDADRARVLWFRAAQSAYWSELPPKARRPLVNSLLGLGPEGEVSLATDPVFQSLPETVRDRANYNRLNAHEGRPSLYQWIQNPTYHLLPEDTQRELIAISETQTALADRQTLATGPTGLPLTGAEAVALWDEAVEIAKLSLSPALQARVDEELRPLLLSTTPHGLFARWKVQQWHHQAAVIGRAAMTSDDPERLDRARDILSSHLDERRFLTHLVFDVLRSDIRDVEYVSDRTEQGTRTEDWRLYRPSEEDSEMLPRDTWGPYEVQPLVFEVHELNFDGHRIEVLRPDLSVPGQSHPTRQNRVAPTLAGDRRDQIPTLKTLERALNAMSPLARRQLRRIHILPRRTAGAENRYVAIYRKTGDAMIYSGPSVVAWDDLLIHLQHEAGHVAHYRTENLPSDAIPVSSYAEQDPGEAFAEGFALYETTRAMPWLDVRYRELYPATYAHFDAIVAGLNATDAAWQAAPPAADLSKPDDHTD